MCPVLAVCFFSVADAQQVEYSRLQVPETTTMSVGQLNDPKEIEVFHMLVCVLRSLVDREEDFEVSALENRDAITFQVRVRHPAMGKIVGKQGRIARAIRVILSANAARIDRAIHLDIASADTLVTKESRSTRADW